MKYTSSILCILVLFISTGCCQTTTFLQRPDGYVDMEGNLIVRVAPGPDNRFTFADGSYCRYLLNPDDVRAGKLTRWVIIDGRKESRVVRCKERSQFIVAPDRTVVRMIPSVPIADFDQDTAGECIVYGKRFVWSRENTFYELVWYVPAETGRNRDQVYICIDAPRRQDSAVARALADAPETVGGILLTVALFPIFPVIWCVYEPSYPPQDPEEFRRQVKEREERTDFIEKLRKNNVLKPEDAAAVLHTREMKPNLATPQPSTSGAK